MTDPWTPGPWKVTTCMDYWVEHEQPLTEADMDFNGVAHCGDIRWANYAARQREWEANARLIAAAPDLVEALETLERECGGADPNTIQRWFDARKNARAVLARVRGEPGKEEK